jgi:plasmid stabilization system protein ParE
MAYRVEITPRAERDLDALYIQMCTTGSEHARLWYLGLSAAISGLHEMPRRCPRTPEDRNLRHLLYGRKLRAYRVIFRIQTKMQAVEILHIRHDARRQFKAADLE